MKSLITKIFTPDNLLFGSSISALVLACYVIGWDIVWLPLVIVGMTLVGYAMSILAKKFFN